MRYERARNAALLLGVGLGGFLDGIVLHQIAHWHQMLSAVVPPDSVEAIKRNMVADGWFHMATWLFTAAGVALLWSAARGAGRLPSTRSLSAYLLLGWGAFNFLEGGISHHLLELHHVQDLPAHDPRYDWLFLIGGGIGFILLGLALREPRLSPPAPLGERRFGLERRSVLH
jgi:uncharacterized membrane protein